MKRKPLTKISNLAKVLRENLFFVVIAVFRLRQGFGGPP